MSYCYDGHFESILHVLWEIEHRLANIIEKLPTTYKPLSKDDMDKIRKRMKEEAEEEE